MTVLNFLLENPTSSFSPGERVVGFITVICEAKTNIKSIKLKCIGEMNFSWSEIKCCQSCRQRQLYLKEKVYLLGKGSSGESGNENSLTLETGRYTFPFTFQLPSIGLPSSFKNDHGSIEYHLCAIMKIGNLILSKVKQIHPFSVNGILDLNSRGPILQRPTQITENGYGKSQDIPGGPCIGFSFTLSKTGFVPGELLHFHSEIFNKTSQTIDFVAVRIQQEILFTGRETCGYLLQRYVYNDVMEYQGPNISPHSNLTWSTANNDSEADLKIKIGDIAYTRRRDRIQINYVVQIILGTSSSGRLVGSIPIIIGTIPFLKNSEDQDDVTLTETRKIYSLPFSGREALRNRQRRTLVALGLFIIIIVVFIICIVVASLYINCC